jgi:hypothetical protein
MKLRQQVVGKKRNTARAASGLLWVLAALAGDSWAGRPLTVDDANTADVGGGQVESWVARQGDRSITWTNTLGVGVWDGLELGASWERNRSSRQNTTALQAKLRLTPSVDGACNLGAVLGAQAAHPGGGRSPYVNGLVTCNMAAATLHGNLGAVRPAGEPTLTTWGIAAEKGWGGVTAHLEYFGQQQGKPTLQAGLRTNILKDLQLDGTLGRTERRTIVSLGLKLGF